MISVKEGRGSEEGERGWRGQGDEKDDASVDGEDEEGESCEREQKGVRDGR